MKLKVFLVGGALSFFSGCSFKGDDSPQHNVERTQISTLEIKENYDSDGDGVHDLDEVNQGRNPFVAEMPELKVNFLQDYKIKISYLKNGEDVLREFEMDTKLKDTDPDYKIRVGKSFARNHTYRKAASFGKFSSHVVGEIENKDFSWVSYPEINSKIFNQSAIEFREILDSNNEIQSITITLSNSARLEKSHLFKSIKDLKVNFYFFNHETDNYELLSSKIVERHFQGGVYESFDVVIEDVPLALLKEGFFKRGEFIISEIEDFEIPDLSMSYKSLLRSVKAKSIPVLYETPLENKLSYVAMTDNGINFHHILKVLFDKNYRIENDVLVQIGQFTNNLPNFTYLKEVKDKSKHGKWFVMTNELKRFYLDHLFSQGDSLVISFITGTELASQEEEKIYSYQNEVSPNQYERVIPLGNVSPNSVINFQLRPLRRFGRQLSKEVENWNRSGGSCGKNCYQHPINCIWEINAYKDYDEQFSFQSDLTKEAEQLDLIVNGEAFVLKELLKEQRIQVSQTQKGIHFQITDINKIKELKDFEENELSLRVRTIANTDFFGVKLVEMGGIWNGVGGCPFNTPAVAEKYRTQISKETRELGEISWLVGDLAKNGYPYRFELLDSGPYHQEFSFGVSSVIENLYN